jgi:xylulokinase
MSLILACDLGGTSFRAALIDAAGVTLAESMLPGPESRDENGRSEIDPELWWRAMATACSDLAASVPMGFAQVAAVAICGITRTQVFLDRKGQSLRPAMTWKDTRSEAVASRLQARFSDAHPEARGLNAFHPLARLAWLQEHEPETLAELALVLEPKDYLNFRLTGEARSDPVSMARLRASAGADGAGGLLGAIGLQAGILPPLIEPWQVVGQVRAGLPAPFDRLLGVPVLCSSNDTWVGVVGLGAMRPGCAYNISGTTEVLGLIGPEAKTAEGLLTVDWRGLFQLGGPSQNGADTVSWLLSLLAGGNPGQESVARSIDALLAGPRHPQPVLFLPYLQGERVPYWDPSLRGALIGLQRQHGATDLAWAVLEGVAFLNRVVLERAETAMGAPVSEIRFGGGAAANPVWRQVKADICGRPILVGAAGQPGLLGAAILAWTGLGHFASLAEAQDRLVAIAARHEPGASATARYDKLYALFRQSEAALTPVSQALVALARTS